MTREERIEAALATAGNDGKHCPKCGGEWLKIIGADGCIWLFCHKCSILESPMLDTYSRSVCDNASIDLRDEVIALRSQVERQDALLFECFQALKETRQGFTTCDDPDCQFCKPHRRADKVLAIELPELDTHTKYICDEIQAKLVVAAPDLRDEVIALRSQVERQWISVKERLPEEGQQIITWTWEKDQVMGYWIEEENAVLEYPDIGCGWSRGFTHWMPLSEPPIAEIEGAKG